MAWLAAYLGYGKKSVAEESENLDYDSDSDQGFGLQTPPETDQMAYCRTSRPADGDSELRLFGEDRLLKSSLQGEKFLRRLLYHTCTDQLLQRLPSMSQDTCSGCGTRALVVTRSSTRLKK
jgi:hypothetical protein